MKKQSLSRNLRFGAPDGWLGGVGVKEVSVRRNAKKMDLPPGEALSSDPRRILLLPREGRFFRDFGAASRGEKNAPLYKRPAAKTF